MSVTPTDANLAWPSALRLIGLLGFAAVCLSEVRPAYADTCYQDEAGRIVTRRRPGYAEVPCPKPKTEAERAGGTPAEGMKPAEGPPTEQPQNPAPGADFYWDRGPPPTASPIPRPGVADYVDAVPVPDRWRIVDSLGYAQNLWDPYNRNILKGDKPVKGDWFFNMRLFSDSAFVYRNLVSAVGSSSSGNQGELDVFGRSKQMTFAQNIGAEFSYYKGDTVFKPPDLEFRFTPVINVNYASVSELQQINVDPNAGDNRTDAHLSVQAAFVDKHLRNVSDRYDFDSVRAGIQPFSTDFRGFLFQDNQLGVRLFGNRNNNVYQYNLALFRRIEKDTNSGLNDLGQPLRRDYVAVANLYRQDTPVEGFTSQITAVYNRNREGDETHYDSNGFLVRPELLGLEVGRNYDVVYLGYNGDGHFGGYNLTTSVYYAGGHETPGTFVFGKVDISAWFGAVELSRDFNWFRGRISLLYGSGDSKPFDRKATGFDAIQENPQFAGGDTSYWISQAVPLVGGGGVTLSGGNGVLASLRSSKDEGQSNFTNPGILLAGIGADVDLLPQLRLAFNCNDLSFADTEVIEAARNQAGVSKHIGEDLSASFIYRPLMTQNIVVRASYARLVTGSGYRALFPSGDPNYFLLNAVFAY
jgi:hypothetical protein